MQYEKMIAMKAQIETELGAELKVKEFTRMGEELYGLELQNGSICPCMWFNDKPEGFTVEDAVKAFSASLEEAKTIPVDLISGRDYILDHVKVCLCHVRYANELEEQDVAWDPLLDMVKYYRVVLNTKDGSCVSFKITNKMLKDAEIELSELRYRAELNTRSEREFKSMFETLSELMPGVEGVIPPMDDEILYVLTNKSKHMGASMIADDCILTELYCRFEDEFYIIPSSIHEVLIYTGKCADPNDLRSMVNEVNSTQVALNEQLSDTVYKFDGDSLKIA